jgi:hypothetical protein
MEPEAGSIFVRVPMRPVMMRPSDVEVKLSRKIFSLGIEISAGAAELLELFLAGVADRPHVSGNRFDLVRRKLCAAHRRHWAPILFGL